MTPQINVLYTISATFNSSFYYQSVCFENRATKPNTSFTNDMKPLDIDMVSQIWYLNYVLSMAACPVKADIGAYSFEQEFLSGICRYVRLVC